MSQCKHQIKSNNILLIGKDNDLSLLFGIIYTILISQMLNIKKCH